MLRYPYQPGPKPPQGPPLPFKSGSFIDLESLTYGRMCNVGDKTEETPYALR